jgi:hypothetical protein
MVEQSLVSGRLPRGYTTHQTAASTHTTGNSTRRSPAQSHKRGVASNLSSIGWSRPTAHTYRNRCFEPPQVIGALTVWVMTAEQVTGEGTMLTPVFQTTWIARLAPRSSTVTLCSPNEDLGRPNQRFRMRFRSTFQRFVAQIEYSRP